jgi:hypothetical protein
MCGALTLGGEAQNLVEGDLAPRVLPPLRLALATRVELDLLFIGKPNLDVDAVFAVAIWTIHLGRSSHSWNSAPVELLR